MAISRTNFERRVTDAEILWLVVPILESARSLAGFRAAEPQIPADERRACYKLHMRCTAAIQLIREECPEIG
jgi:hypothetical protein